MNNAVILACQQLTKRYAQGELDVEVLKGINLTINAGELTAIMGASGSGKSTLLHLLGGLDKPTAGEVVLAGVNLNQVSANKLAKLRNQSLGFIYQAHHLLGEFTVLENVAMPLLIGGESVKHAKQRAEGLLARVGLGHRIKHKPGELSGGERQRAAVARALINKPALILADEPTGNLDSKTGANITELLFELNQERGTTLILVTHDARLAARCGQSIQLSAGRVL